MTITMPYSHILNLRRLLAIAATTVAGFTPVLAHAQFKVNDLYGKTFPQVVKMLGQPVEKTEGGPVTFSRFKTPGALDTIVWYSYYTGIVGKVQIQIVAKPGETPDQILKRYGLALGTNVIHVEVKLPSMAMASVGSVPGMPWVKIFIARAYAAPFAREQMKYCKEHHLKPYSTYFWIIQVTSKQPDTGGRMMGAGDTGDKAHKKGGGKGKGKGK